MLDTRNEWLSPRVSYLHLNQEKHRVVALKKLKQEYLYLVLWQRVLE